MLTYIAATQWEREKKTKMKEKPYNNLTKSERTSMKERSCYNWTRTHNHLVHKRTLIHLAKLAIQSIKELIEREDIIVTKASKGGAAVIVDVKDHIKEAERQLNNTANYRKLQKDSTATNMKLVNDTIERFRNQKLINERSQTV